MKSVDVNRVIESLGGEQVSQRGSHRKYAVVVAGVTYSTIVAQHRGHEIPVGTLLSIQRSLEPAFGKGWLA
ncbi:putative RNA binding protein YcfA (HicA-like mRNA interferase family) [Frondihabitans australicus]|uniref:Putative RNA binding protein YcfA (HicA-like mRNA interferase family) n=2 Tax=Frondihabitans australicus TaxID=386892 RepID=A0A495IHU8_9MICO|nr:putative RNA binding protein YcfA (HicA-like mRNA interferase family) [Frondihabitans australicus]